MLDIKSWLVADSAWECMGNCWRVTHAGISSIGLATGSGLMLNYFELSYNIGY